MFVVIASGNVVMAHGNGYLLGWSIPAWVGLATHNGRSSGLIRWAMLPRSRRSTAAPERSARG